MNKKFEAAALGLGTLAALGFSGCASKTTSGSTTVPTGYVLLNPPTVINPMTGQVSISIGGGDYIDPTTGQVSISIGGNEYLNPATGAVSFGDGMPAETKDVDLKQAQLERTQLQEKAQAVAGQFGMSLDSAVQVTVLADRMNALKSGGNQITPQDMAALIDAAYVVAGVKAEDVNAAAQRIIQTGDESAADALLAQAAAHMGMSSTTALRDEILPSIGINLK